MSFETNGNTPKMILILELKRSEGFHDLSSFCRWVMVAAVGQVSL